MYKDDCGCTKRADFNPGKKCDNSCIEGLQERLHRCEWVLIYTTGDSSPVFGHIKKVTCDVVVLEQVSVPMLIPYVTEVVVSLCQITKFVKLGGPGFNADSVTDAMKKRL